MVSWLSEKSWSKGKEIGRGGWGFLFLPITMHNHYTHNGGGLSEVRRKKTNININQAPIDESDDTHPFLSLWEAPGGNLVCVIWSNSPRAAAAMAATAIAEAGLNDRAEYVCTVKFSAQLLAEASSEIKLIPFYQNGGTNLYLVLAVLSDGSVGFHYLRSTSCAAASETVKKALSNSAALHTFRLDASSLKAAKSMIDSGKCGLIVFLSV